MRSLYKPVSAEHLMPTDGGIHKPLSPELFLDHRPLLRHRAGDPTGDLALSAEMRWEAMKEAGYLRPRPTASSSETTRRRRTWTS